MSIRANQNSLIIKLMSIRANPLQEYLYPLGGVFLRIKSF
jgi:hypothetical protein